MLELFPKALSIYKWGSSTLPFIKSPNDIDYVIIYKNEEDIKSLEIPKQEELDFHFFILNLEDLSSGKYLKILNNFSEERYHALFQASCSNANLVMFHWTELVEGQDLNLNQYFNIIEDQNSLESLRISILRISEFLFLLARTTNQILKEWYYLALAFYIYINKSYSLTSAQIEIINKFHDLTATFDDCVWLYNQINLIFDTNL